MVHIGTFTEADLRLKKDKKACDKIKKETSGVICYFKTKLKKRKGVIVALDVYGLTVEEYRHSNFI